MALPSFQDLYDLAKAEIILRRPLVKAFVGSIADMISAGAAAIGDRVLFYAAERFRATYLDGARGDDLSQLADDHFNIQRFAAVQAFGVATFTRSVANAFSVTIPAGTVVATVRDSQGNEVRFTTDTSCSWNASEGGTKLTGITAEQGGVAGNVAPGTVTRVVSSLTEAFTVTNAFACVGGAEEEPDEDLRERCRQFSQTLRRGTKDAIEFGAKTVPSVKRASAVEDPSGLGFVYVSDIDGNSNQQMVDAVVTELENWRALGSFVQVIGATKVTQNIAITVTLRAGADLVVLTPLIQAAVTGRVNKLKIGDTLYKLEIQHAAKSVAPDDILNVVVITPGSDVTGVGSVIIRCGNVAVG